MSRGYQLSCRVARVLGSDDRPSPVGPLMGEPSRTTTKTVAPQHTLVWIEMTLLLGLLLWVSVSPGTQRKWSYTARVASCLARTRILTPRYPQMCTEKHNTRHTPTKPPPVDEVTTQGCMQTFVRFQLRSLLTRKSSFFRIIACRKLE